MRRAPDHSAAVLGEPWLFSTKPSPIHRSSRKRAQHPAVPRRTCLPAKDDIVSCQLLSCCRTYVESMKTRRDSLTLAYANDRFVYSARDSLCPGGRMSKQSEYLHELRNGQTHAALFFSFRPFGKQRQTKEGSRESRADKKDGLSRTWCMRPCSFQPSVRYLPES